MAPRIRADRDGLTCVCHLQKTTRRNATCSPPSAAQSIFGQLDDYNDIDADTTARSNQRCQETCRARESVRYQGYTGECSTRKPTVEVWCLAVKEN